MPHKRSILPKILLSLGVLALFLVLKYHSSLQDLTSYAKDWIRVNLDNSFYQSKSEGSRRRPLSLVERETELKLYIGEPFKSFTHKEWDYFWHLAYDTFPVEEPQEQGLPAKVRQLTIDEIADKLMKRYPDPFAFFKLDHWEALFGIALKK